MAGAFTLAQELAASPGDHRLAFGRYELWSKAVDEPLA
jgi:hypothetical protein